ncbi:MAG: dTDP-glucose 4,6-dehydratase [Desulfobacca sp.]|uniref:dTDP-glucose 4,6-dehydratase n=1 Tax=Desulfobacca sp. TaxID=2067990 RepID=UPI004049D8F8
MRTWLVTGGAGFIGSNFILQQRAADTARIINLDKLTYAGNPQNLAGLQQDSNYIFQKGDIGDRDLVAYLLRTFQPGAIIHFAAESHVDRSIRSPEAFIETNVVGTFRLLDEVRYYWQELPLPQKKAFRFLHISTDEVYGSLGPLDPAFTESTPYAPNSPYSASKAAADHLVRAYHATYGLPILITNCSNNYGPFQFPEKFIPLLILNARQGKHLPIYGDGLHVRDWLFVTDHCDAIRVVLERGRVGESYNIGGRCEKTNLEVATQICMLLDAMFPRSPSVPHASLIVHVPDRPGHDRRYAMDISKIEGELGWTPRESFDSGLAKTIRWYLDNPQWVEAVTSGAYRQWLQVQYGAST